jgi:tRNA G37 N-methylase Trm5
MAALISWAKSLASRRLRALTRHLPSDNLVGTIYRTPNGVFSIAASDIYIANVLRQNRAWAAEEVQAIRAATSPGDRVLFVGAHVGTLVIPVSRHVREVVAVEANPDTFRFLSTNLLLNEVANVTLHPVAAGEADGEIEFLLSRQNSGGAKRRPITADPRYV